MDDEEHFRFISFMKRTEPNNIAIVANEQAGCLKALRWCWWKITW